MTGIENLRGYLQSDVQVVAVTYMEFVTESYYEMKNTIKIVPTFALVVIEELTQLQLACL